MAGESELDSLAFPKWDMGFGHSQSDFIMSAKLEEFLMLWVTLTNPRSKWPAGVDSSVSESIELRKPAEHISPQV